MIQTAALKIGRVAARRCPTRTNFRHIHKALVLKRRGAGVIDAPTQFIGLIHRGIVKIAAIWEGFS